MLWQYNPSAMCLRDFVHLSLFLLFYKNVTELVHKSVSTKHSGRLLLLLIHVNSEFVINISNLNFFGRLMLWYRSNVPNSYFFYFSISKYDCDLGSVCHSHFFGLPQILCLTELTDDYNRQFCTAKCSNPAPNISADYYVLQSVLELSCGSSTEVWKQKMKLKKLQKSWRKRRMAAVKM